MRTLKEIRKDKNKIFVEDTANIVNLTEEEYEKQYAKGIEKYKALMAETTILNEHLQSLTIPKLKEFIKQDGFVSKETKKQAIIIDYYMNLIIEEDD